MAIAFVAGTKVTNNDGGTSGSINTSGATLLVAIGAFYGATAGGPGVTISDSNGNTWTALTERGPAGTRSCRVWYAVNPSVGSGHTFTVTGTDSFAAVYFSSWSGVDTSSPFDVQGGINSVTGTGGYIGSEMVPSADGALVIGGWSTINTGTVSAQSGWTLGDSDAYTAAGYWGGGYAYQIQTTATTVAALTKISNISGGSEDLAAASAVFKAGTGGGASATPIIMNHYRQRRA
jgi:hypothetical protein